MAFSVRKMAAVALAAGMALIGIASAQQKPLQKIRIGFASSTSPMLIAYYSSVPLSLFWKDEGLEVESMNFNGSNAAAEALDAGVVDVTLGQSSGLFALLNKQPNAGVISFYALITTFNSTPHVIADSPLKTVLDLQGRTVGLNTLGTSQLPTTQALVQMAGGDSKAVKFVAIGEGMEAVYAIQQKRVDAFNMADGFMAQVEGMGVKIRALEVPGVNVDDIGFSGALMTKRTFFEKNKDLLTRLARGVAKASVFTHENPEAAAQIHWKVYPLTQQRSVPRAEALRLATLQVKARMKNVAPIEGLYGYSTDAQIRGAMDVLVRGNLIKAPLDIRTLWTPELVKEINNFDQEAVKRMARDWKP